MGKWRLAVFAALFFLVSASSLSARPAPPFKGELLGGGRVALLQSLKPQRGLLVCFWASWCVPCLEELHHVAEKLKNDPNFPLDVLTINVDTSETSSDVKPTVKLHNLKFPIVLDPKHEIFSKYQDAKTLPFSVLVGPTGQIEHTFTGFQEDMFTRVKETVDKYRVANVH